MFDVNQTFRSPTADDDDDTVEALQSQEQPLEGDQEGNDAANEEKTKLRLEQFTNARQSVAKNNILRHMAIMKLDFTNWLRVEYKVNDHGEEHEVKKEADQGFSDEINNKIEHYGALFVKY